MKLKFFDDVLSLIFIELKLSLFIPIITLPEDVLCFCSLKSSDSK